MALIECVPNVSEGQRTQVIDTIAAAIAQTQGVYLLDRSSDPTHNRSVFTLAAEAPSFRHGVIALFEAALRSIDLRVHRGAHPRLGAVDVVPFIPLEDTTMAECVALARDTGAAIAHRFGLPVFLYEEAASTPARRNLADIRRGEFEGLGAKLADPAWAPDYGPSFPHPSGGATVIGARRPLIAFNVNLASGRMDVAKAIAARVRESSGGLPHVKAMAVALEARGIVQVSMNLTNFEKTSISRAFEAVRREAECHGTTVLESEIVGLVPQAALPDAPEQSLQLAGFTRGQVLERRIKEMREQAG
jgi:glutamate formiminotransferase / 5-formyltetrahydrofolate cyclo-ligase